MRRAAIATSALLALAAIVAVLFVPWLEVRREQSADGEFLMVTAVSFSTRSCP